MDLTQVREHLRFARELGIKGVSRDASWRTREVANPPREPAEADQSVLVEDELGGAMVSASGAAGGGMGSASGAGRGGKISTAVTGRGGMVGEDSIPPGDALPPDATAAMAVFANAAEALAAIRADIGDCTRCKLHTLGRQRIVFGVGNPNADLMFVGEAPGADEDIQGVPFVGKAGQLLTKIIEAIEMSRDDVYIANVIKCRPPQNRNPELDEVASCEPFLFRQIEVIKPKVIVALGKFAAQTLLRTEEPISRLRGRVFAYRGVPLVPTFHPAYLLRNPSSKREVWEDMKMVRGMIRGASA